MKALLLPPTVLIFVALAGLVAMRWRRRHGIALVAAALAALYLLATPLVGGMLLRSHERAPALVRVPAEAAVIVVLGADVVRDQPEYGGVAVGPLTLERLEYAARLHHDTGLPVLTSGGFLPGLRFSVAELMAETLERDFRVPVRWRETRSHSTASNASETTALMRREGIAHGVLVTHAWHMPRAAAAFERAGLPLVPAPTRFTPATGWEPIALLPSVRALAYSHYAFHEWAGRAWYRLRGLPAPAGRPLRP